MPIARPLGRPLARALCRFRVIHGLICACLNGVCCSKILLDRHFSVSSVQQAKKKASSTSRYLSRQASDPYVLSRTSPSHASSLALPPFSEGELPGEKFVSRSAFKLFQLEEKHHFLVPKKGNWSLGRARMILDLGAAPGGWTQMALRLLRTSKSLAGEVEGEHAENGEAMAPPPIIALDLLPLHPSVQALPGVSFIQGDFESEEVKRKLAESVQVFRAEEGRQVTDSEPKVDVILSDMLANTTGSPLRDGALSLSLLHHLYLFVHRHLSASPSSFLVLKIFPSPEAEIFRRKMLQYSIGKKQASKGGAFESVKTEKPPGSRKESREVYWVCKGYRGSEKCWTLDEWYEMEEACA